MFYQYYLISLFLLSFLLEKQEINTVTGTFGIKPYALPCVQGFTSLHG